MREGAAVRRDDQETLFGMAPLSRLIAALGFLALLIMAVVLVGPSLVDWTQHKALVEKALSRAVGRPVAIAGDVELTLLPQPRFSFSDVTVDAGPDGSAPLAVARVEALLGLQALLGGEVHAERARLIGAELRLDDWSGLAAPLVITREPPPEPDAGEAPRPSSPRGIIEALVREVRIDRLTLEKSRLVIGAEPGLDLVIAYGTAKLASLAGPIEADLAVGSGEDLTDIGIALGPFAAGEPTRIKLLVSRDAAGGRKGFEASLMGQAQLDSGGEVRGRADLTISTNGEPVEGFFGELLPARGGVAAALQRLDSEGGIEASGTISLAGTVLEAKSIAVRVGEAKMTAAGLIDVGPARRAEVRLAGGGIDLGRGIAAPVRADPAPQRAEGPFFTTSVVGLTLDDSRAGALAIERLEATTVRAPGRAAETSIRLRMTGGTEASATLVESADGGGERGPLRVTSGDPRALAASLGLELGRGSSRRLGRTTLDGHIAITARDIAITDAVLGIDEARATGSIQVRRSERPIFAVSLSADRIDADALGLTDAVRGPTLGGFDLAAKVVAEELIVRGETFTRARIDGRLEKGSLTVAALELGRRDGGRLALSGKIDGMSDARPDGRLAGTLSGASACEHGLGAARIALPAAEPVVRRLCPRLASPVLDVAAVFGADGATTSATGTISGRSARLEIAPAGGASGGMPARAVAASIEVAEARLAVEGQIDADGSAFDLTASAGDVSETDIAALLFAPQGAPAPSPGGEGTHDVKLRIVRKGSTYRIENAVMRGPNGALDATGTFSGTGRDAVLGLEITVDPKSGQRVASLFDPHEEKAVLWLNRAVSPEIIALFSGAEARAEIAVRDEAGREVAAIAGRLAGAGLVADRLTGQFLGGTVEGRGSLEVKPDAVAVALDIVGTKIDLARLVLAEPALVGEGEGRLRISMQGSGRTPFWAMRDLTGIVEVAADTGVFRGFDLAAFEQALARGGEEVDLAARAALAAGRTPFSQLSLVMTVNGGVMQSAGFAAEGEAASFGGTLRVDLPGRMADATLTVKPSAGTLPPLVRQGAGTIRVLTTSWAEAPLAAAIAAAKDTARPPEEPVPPPPPDPAALAPPGPDAPAVPVAPAAPQVPPDALQTIKGAGEAKIEIAPIGGRPTK